MKARTILATIVAIGAVAAGALATNANAMPACKSTCYSAGTWFWNKQMAETKLYDSGIDVAGQHYEVSTAECYGMGSSMWGSKGPQFQKFHCAVKPFTYSGTKTYQPYGLTFYVRGQYAWTWSG